MRERKNEISYKITLDEEQKEAKRAILDNEIVIVTGRAGCGKTALVAQTILDMLFKREIDKVIVTRATVEVGNSLGFLPGDMATKLSPYLAPFIESLYACYDEDKVNKHLTHFADGQENVDKNSNRKSIGKIEGTPVQFIRGKTIGERTVLVCEEAQNFTEFEMEAILTRLGKGGKIIINGDNAQSDIYDKYTGIDYAIELSKAIPEIKHFNLTNNHRSGLVKKILDYKYEKIERKKKTPEL